MAPSILFIFIFGIFSMRGEADTHIVYLGNVDKSLHPQAITDSHHSLLEGVLGSPEAARESLGFSYRHGFSGFSARLSEEQAAKISSLPNVLSVFPNQNYQLHTTNSWEFLGLYGSGKKSLFGVSKVSESSLLWKETNYGEDIIIGVLDSGVWPESASFSDDGMGPVPKRWKGVCESGEQFNSSHCNRKLIGARFFTSGLEGGPETYATIHQEVLSSRDVDGHGTHTASTAGGRFVRNANWSGYASGTAVGGAPNSRIAVYKVCWRNITDNRVRCPGSHILAAFDMGIHDGVDIFSVSIGFGIIEYFTDPISIGAFHAMQKGIVVVAGAGNEQQSEGDGSVKNIAPWIITVGASTIDRAFLTNVSLGNNQSFTGFSLTDRRLRKKWYPLVSSDHAGLPTSNISARKFCFPGSLDPKKVHNKIVACFSGEFNPSSQSDEVFRAGGAGIIILNLNQDIELRGLPYALLNGKAAQAIVSYINSTSSPVAVIHQQTTRRNIKPAPIMADFSSSGPNLIDPDILKPDITAPGVFILAAISQFNNSETAFGFISGTSMSCPHVTGVVALLKSYHPTWSPAAIKSAILTTAYPFDNLGQTINNALLSPATPFNFGGGHINPNAAAHPGLVYDADEQDYITYLCGMGYSINQLRILTEAYTKCPDNAQGLNYPSISVSDLRIGKVVYRRVTNVDDDATTYTATVEAPKGVSISIEPSILHFKHKGDTRTFLVRFRVDELKNSTYKFGKLQWTNGIYTVTSPIVVRQIV